MIFGSTCSRIAVAISMIAGAPSLAAAQDAAPAEIADTSGISDIIVTATRREESLQRVPIAVVAVSGESLQNAGLTNSMQLGSVTPGLVMNTQRSTLTPYLRGVGTENGGVGEEGSIATYIDGVYVTALSGANLAFNNIERIEVLKGPQGTLFGRNATGGLIQVVTRKPSHTPMVDAQIGYDNYETITASVYGTAGLTDTVAVDIAGFFTDQGQGWGVNTSGIPGRDGEKINYRDEWAVRGSILFEPTDTISLRVAADYGHRESDIGNVRVIIPGTRSIINTTFDGAFYGSDSELPRDVDFDQWGVSLIGEVDLGGPTLRSITAYREVENFTLFDQDSTQAKIVEARLGERTTSFQQELILLGTLGRLDYTTGLFYFHSSAGNTQFDIRSVGPSNNFNQTSNMGTDSYAAFAQFVYALTDTTNLTAGVRYTHDERHIKGVRVAAPPNPAPAGTVLLTSATNPSRGISNNATYNKVTWRFGIDHQLTPDVLLYGSVSRGFKSGIYNLTNPFTPPADPETLDAYEIGFKSDLIDRTLRLNMSGFYYDYSDIQLSSIIAGTTIIYNAAAAKVYGVDAEAIVAPPVAVGDLQLRASVSILESEYTKFDTATVFRPVPPAPANQAFINQDVSGNQLRFAPPVTISLGADYSVPVGELELRFNANYNFNSGFYWEPGNRKDIRQDSYDLLNARVTLAGADDRWRASLFMNNITDKRYLTQLTATALGDQGSYGAPRTYGVTLGFKFGG